VDAGVGGNWNIPMFRSTKERGWMPASSAIWNIPMFRSTKERPWDTASAAFGTSRCSDRRRSDPGMRLRAPFGTCWRFQTAVEPAGSIASTASWNMVMFQLRTGRQRASSRVHGAGRRFVVGLRRPVLSCPLVGWGSPPVPVESYPGNEGANHQSRPACKSDDPDPTGPGRR